AADNQHAFLWTNADGMIDLHRVADADHFSFPLAISARGQVVGYSFSIYPAPFFSRAFSWTNADGWIDLTSASTQSLAVALNGRGQVVGWMDTPPYGERYRAFLWTSVDGVVDLGTL